MVISAISPQIQSSILIIVQTAMFTRTIFYYCRLRPIHRHCFAKVRTCIIVRLMRFPETRTIKRCIILIKIARIVCCLEDRNTFL